MPALALVPPIVLKNALVHAGCALHREDSFNWILVNNGIPIVVPKRGKLVAMEVMENCLIDCKMAMTELLMHVQAVGHTFGA